MSSYVCRQGIIAMPLILLLVMICARAAAMPNVAVEQRKQQQQQLQEVEAELTTTETTLEQQEPQLTSPSQLTSPHIDCKLTFDATMDSLELKQLKALQLLDNGCNVLHTSSSTNKPADAGPRKEQQEQQGGPASILRHSMTGSSSQPLYELQLVVWPVDIEDDDDFVTAADSTTTTTTTTATTTTTPGTTSATTTTPSMLPLYEDQLVVFPQMDFEEENFDYFFDELETALTPNTTGPPTSRPSSTTTPRTTTTKATPTGTVKPTQPVYVVQNYRVKHPNGTEEHKLVLSNGLVNYIKLYRKRVGEKLINVQEGYNSVPVAGQKSTVQTLHYIADERGYNVNKIEQNPQSSFAASAAPSAALPLRARYKTTKAPESNPKV